MATVTTEAARAASPSRKLQAGKRSAFRGAGADRGRPNRPTPATF